MLICRIYLCDNLYFCKQTYITIVIHYDIILNCPRFDTFVLGYIDSILGGNVNKWIYKLLLFI